MRNLLRFPPLSSRAMLLGAMLAATAAGSHVAVAKDTFLPISSDTEQKSLPGKFVYAQLTTPDLEQSEKFYGELFGWTFKEVSVSAGHYVQALAGDKNVASFVEHSLGSGSKKQPAWLPFIATSDIDQLVDGAKGLGARVLFQPKNIPGIGHEAIVVDPQGAVFAAVNSSSGDPADTDTPTTQGQWVWDALLTKTPVDAAGFYQKLFSYTVEPQRDSHGNTRFLISSEGSVRGTINPLPDHMADDDPAIWLGFIQVDNVEATVAKVSDLGGKVLVEPHVDHENSVIAVIADPAGAVIGIMEPRDPSATGDAK